MEKPESKGKVTAKRVFNLFPSMQTIPLKNQILHVMNDDIEAIEEKVTDEKVRQSYYKNNGQFLNKDTTDDKYALYRHDDTHQLKEQTTKLLGKRIGKIDELSYVSQYEMVRNYSFAKHENKTKDEFVVKIDRHKNIVTFMPISQKVALQKKKKIGQFGTQDVDQVGAAFMCVAARGYTDKELQRIQKSYNELGAGNVLKTSEDAHFKDRNDMRQLEEAAADEIEKSFKPRLDALEELFKKEHRIGRVQEQDA